jgi:hypothetical protein
VLRRSVVVEVLGRLAAHRGERAVHGADHLADVDLIRAPGQPVAALGAALGAHDPGVPQVDQDVLEELQRDVLGLCEPLALDGPVTRLGELEQRAHRVVALSRDLHGRNDRLARWT